MNLLSPVLEPGRQWAFSHAMVAGEVCCPRRGSIIDVERCMRCASLRDIIANDHFDGEVRCWTPAGVRPRFP